MTESNTDLLKAQIGWEIAKPNIFFAGVGVTTAFFALCYYLEKEDEPKFKVPIATFEAYQSVLTAEQRKELKPKFEQLAELIEERKGLSGGKKPTTEIALTEKITKLTDEIRKEAGTIAK